MLVVVMDARVSRQNHELNPTRERLRGGVLNGATGDLRMARSAIVGNGTCFYECSGYGGGIYNEGILELVDSSVDSNSGGAGPGGIFNAEGTTTHLLRSQVSNNGAAEGIGGIGYFGTVVASIARSVSMRPAPEKETRISPRPMSRSFAA